MLRDFALRNAACDERKVHVSALCVTERDELKTCWPDLCTVHTSTGRIYAASFHSICASAICV